MVVTFKGNVNHEMCFQLYKMFSALFTVARTQGKTIVY